VHAPPSLPRSEGPVAVTRGSALGSSDEPLATAYDAALLDLDGVVYVGPHLVPGAAGALDLARRAGLRLAFVTNNAARSADAVAAHLCDLGVPATAADVATAAQAAARILRERLPAGAPVLVVGGPGLVAAVRDAGFAVVAAADPRPAAVVQGYTDTTTYAELAEAALAIRAGALWVASNRDATMPSPRGQVPGNGAMVAALAVATGREPVVAGKPELALHQESMARVGASRALVVGDRLDTDIAGAARAGCDSLLVLTGVTDVDLLLAAPPGMRPTYLAADLGGLLRAHPTATVDSDGTARCGAWTATVDGATATARCVDAGAGEENDDGLDGLRATAAARWARADAS